jgi:hypothetical protein
VTLTEVSELRGLWQRSMIEWPDGQRDITSSVRWLQGVCTCIDLRQRAAAKDFPRPRSIRELSIDHCAWLAQQQGFAGRCVFDGGYFQWLRAIDFQPRTSSDDAGSLRWQGGVLVETGRDVAYVEHWHRDASAPTLPAVAATLREANENTAAALLRVGAMFMFARDRAVLPAAGRTLAECVAAASSLRHAQQLVDCEISFGDVRAGVFRITASTLPFRIGDALEPHFARERLTTLDRAADGAALTRHWEITAVEGEFGELGELHELGVPAGSCGGH